MQLSELARICATTLKGEDSAFTSVSIDSRTLKQGGVFFALAGAHDGHDFIAAAEQAGAVAVVVSRVVATSLPCIQVSDTLKALTQLAQAKRDAVHIPVIAITGSCGKTTIRALLSQILQQAGKVLASQASFNNEIGVPLTLAQLNADYDYVVQEVGANHAGEIQQLTQLIRPTLAVISVVAPVHLAGFGSEDAVASAKAELYEGLASDGVAVINADDAYADFFQKKLTNHRVVHFSMQKAADVSAQHVQLNSAMQASFDLCTPQGQTTIKLQLLGEHNVVNALAAASCAVALDIDLEKIKQGLQMTQPEQHRLVIREGRGGVRIIDDTYNANPRSMLAALQILTQYRGERIFVVGDMAELGANSAEFHRQLGEQARDLGIKRLFCCGDLTALTAESFGAGAQFYKDQQSLINELRACLTAEATVLIKGSRSIGLEKVVSALLEE